MKKIKFIPMDEITEKIVSPPQPASKFLPEWYKKINIHIDQSSKTFRLPKTDFDSNFTVKKCMPFFDTMTSGYIVTLPCDIVFVDPEKYKGKKIIWESSFDPVGSHGTEQIYGMPAFSEKNEMWKWYFNYIIETPPGYSCYFSHPKYKFDLPFYTLEGIVDTDTHLVPVNFPFLISKNFKGKIKMGTPICQIFPFKRDNWNSVIMPYEKNNKFRSDKMRLMVENSYKLRFWNKKNYS